MKMLRLILLIGSCLVLLMGSAMARSVFEITIPTNVVRLDPVSVGTLIFTVKNVSGITLQNITVPQTRFLNDIFSATVASTTCNNATLTNNQTCTVTLNISGVANGTASLSPIVCAFSSLVCSRGMLTVEVNNIHQAVPVASFATTLPANVVPGTSYPITATFLNPDTQYSITGINITDTLPNTVQTENTCQGGVLLPQTSCFASYLFTPPSDGTYYLASTFSYNEGSPILASRTVLATSGAVSGSVAMPLPANVEKDRTYPVLFSYTNFGSAAVTDVNVTVNGFTVVNNTCSGTLAANNSCYISGNYTAATTVGPVTLSTNLTVTGPGTISPVVLSTASIVSDVAITGSISPTLPTSIIPGVSYPVVFTFNNPNTTLPAAEVTVDKLLPNFTETSDTCGATLEPNTSCAIAGSFQTSTEGPVALTTIFKHDGNIPVSLTTTSNAAAAALVATVNGFPSNVDRDTPYTVTFTFSNYGSRNAVINSTTLSFPNIEGTATDNCNGQTIAPEGSCTISGVFRNASVGTASWSATVNYTGGGSLNVTETTNTNVTDVVVTGTVATPLSANGLPNVSRPFSFNFTNNSSQTANDLQIVTSLPQTSNITNTCEGKTTLAANESCTISGDFNSSFVGPQILSATLLYQEGSPVTLTTSTDNYQFSTYNNAFKTGDFSATLTVAQNSQRGIFSSNRRIDFSKNFQINLTLNFDNKSNVADGIAIIIHNSSVGASAIGNSGGAVGATPINNGIFYKFALLTGSSSLSLRNTSNGSEIKNIPISGIWSGSYNVILSWDASNKQLTLSVPAVGVTDVQAIDLSQSQYLGAGLMGYVGISASTGAINGQFSTTINSLS